MAENDAKAIQLCQKLAQHHLDDVLSRSKAIQDAISLEIDLRQTALGSTYSNNIVTDLGLLCDMAPEANYDPPSTFP